MIALFITALVVGIGIGIGVGILLAPVLDRGPGQKSCHHDLVLAHTRTPYVDGTMDLFGTCLSCGADQKFPLGRVASDRVAQVRTVKLQALGYQQITDHPEAAKGGTVWARGGALN